MQIHEYCLVWPQTTQPMEQKTIPSSKDWGNDGGWLMAVRSL